MHVLTPIKCVEKLRGICFVRYHGYVALGQASTGAGPNERLHPSTGNAPMKTVLKRVENSQEQQSAEKVVFVARPQILCGRYDRRRAFLGQRLVDVFLFNKGG